MNDKVKLGRKRTILISISIILVSIHTIYFYQSAQPEINLSKLMTQIVRLALTIVLLFLVYKGKKWAKILALILFSLATLGALFGIIINESTLLFKIPMLVMILVYSTAIHHFGFSASFKAFLSYQNDLNKPINK